MTKVGRIVARMVPIQSAYRTPLPLFRIDVRRSAGNSGPLVGRIGSFDYRLIITATALELVADSNRLLSASKR